MHNSMKTGKMRALRAVVACALALVCAWTAVSGAFAVRAETTTAEAATAAEPARLAAYIEALVDSKKAHANIDPNETLLGNPLYLAGASSTDTDWFALALARFGYADADGFARYTDAMRAYVTQTYAKNSGLLHRAKATEWQRAALTVAAMGADPRQFGTYQGAAIDLIADGSFNSPLRSGPGMQGINGWIWGLIAMDSGAYAVPEDAKYPRARFITEILSGQKADGVDGNEYGGWALGGSTSDVDITAMCIQALAPYYCDDTVYSYTNAARKREETRAVRACVDEALAWLRSVMDANAGFTSWGSTNAESVAQVIVALTSLGIDPLTDARFITEKGDTLLDGLLQYRLPDGGFAHVQGGAWNGMACDQAALALVALWRQASGMRALYDMRPESAPAPEEPEEPQQPQQPQQPEEPEEPQQPEEPEEPQQPQQPEKPVPTGADGLYRYAAPALLLPVCARMLAACRQRRKETETERRTGVPA